MKTRSIVLTLSLSLMIMLVAVCVVVARPKAAEAAPAAQTGDYITLTVKVGESLATYARLYSVSGDALLAANPAIKDANRVYPGQVLIIPVVRSFIPSLTTPFYYTVQAGDNIYAIARRFRMDASVIMWANGLQNDIVILGRTYLIPAGPHYHIVQRAETLYTIAGLYGVSVSALQTLNDVPNPVALYRGQYIYIPVTFNAQPMPFTVPTATSVPTATPITTTVPTATPNPAYTSTATSVATSAATATATASATKTSTPLPTATANVTPVAGNNIVITVRQKENLVTYTYRYGVRGAALLAANPQLKDPSKLYPGDQLIIPVAVSFTPSRSTPFFYVVMPGDTLATLGAKFEMTPDVISNANPGLVSVAAGVTLLIPAGPHVYAVKAGDEIRYIAAKYGTTVEYVLAGNDLPNPDRIYLGQLIFIPIQYGAAPVPYTP